MISKSISRIIACVLGSFLLFPAARAADSNELQSNLRLKVSGDHRFLVDSNGKPFLIVGDAAWSLIAQLDEADIETYLADREKKGFNAIIVNLIEHKFASHAPQTLSGLAPFATTGDFSTPNPAYFDFAHQVVELAGKRGLVVFLAPAYLGYGGGDEGFFQEIKAGGWKKLLAYGEFVGRRFKDLPNIVWMVGGDYTPQVQDQWTVTELAETIHAADPGHLMTAHHSPGSSAVEAFGPQDWLALNTYYGYDKLLFRPMRAEYDRLPARPYVLLETTYEGEHDSTPDEIRQQAYWAMLSGACGQFFGNNPIWRFDGPGLFPVKMMWKQALNAAGSQDMARLQKLFIALPWHKLRPDVDHSLLVDGYGSGVGTGLAAITEDRKLAVIYLPSTGMKGHALTFAMDQFAGPMIARWYDPTNGLFQSASGSPLENRGTHQFRTPGDNGAGANDWVLVLDAR